MNPVTAAAIRPAKIPARYPIETMRPNRRLTWRMSKMRSASSQKTIPFKNRGTSIQIASAIRNHGCGVSHSVNHSAKKLNALKATTRGKKIRS